MGGVLVMVILIVECRLCPFVSQENLEMVKHMFDSHTEVCHYCCIDDCKYLFRRGTSYSSFLGHALRKHIGWRDVINDNPLPCFFLDKFSTEANVEMDCDIHGNKCDNDCYDETCMDTEYNSVSEPNCVYETDFECEADVEYDSRIPTAHANASATKPDPILTAGLFLLSFKERYRLSQSAINYAMHCVDMMVSATCENIYEHVENKLLECGIAIPNDLKDCLSTLKSPFSNLKTKYQQRKFYKDKLGLVVSTVKPLTPDTPEIRTLGFATNA